MIKRTEIFWGIALIISAFIFWMSECAKADETYVIPGLQGGINRAFDGTNLQPDQAFDLVNLIFLPNALQVRQGFSWLDSIQIDTFDVDAIYSFQKKDGNIEMLRVVNGFIYPSDGIGRTAIDEWGTTRLHRKVFGIDVADGRNTLFQVFHPAVLWTNQYSYVSAGDYIDIDFDTSDSEYIIESLGLNSDSIIILTTDYVGTDTSLATGSIYKHIAGKSSFSTYQNIVYICDSEGFALKYRGKNILGGIGSDRDAFDFLALVDSGHVDTVDAIQDSSEIYRGRGLDRAGGSRNKFILYWPTDIDARPAFDTSYVKIGLILKIYQCDVVVKGRFAVKSWASTITEVDTLGHYMKTSENLPDGYEVESSSWGVLNNREVCTLNDTSYVSIDTGKHFYDIQFGDDFLVGFQSVSTYSGILKFQNMLCHGDDYFQSAENVFTVGAAPAHGVDMYYVFSRLPYDFDSDQGDTNNYEFPRFEQTFFYNDQLYAFGYEEVYGLVDTALSSTATSFNRVWYSDIAFPEYIAPFYNFDVGSNEDISVMFQLRNELFIGTDISIWRSSGLPQIKGVFGTQVLSTAISGGGIPDLDNWAKSTEEYGYFVNLTGGYRFNGVRSDEIAWLVGPIIRDNYASDIVMVYQRPNLYVSFPDSNFTLVFNEDYAYSMGSGKIVLPSTKLDFGMVSAYAPPDTNIIYFGHSEYPGRIYFYPNGEYWDRSSTTDSSAIDIVYESGYQSLTVRPWTSKRLTTGYFPIDSDTSFHVDIFTDFSGTASDTFTSATYGSRVYRIDNLSGVGDYFKTKITATVIDTFRIRPYWLNYQEADMKEGD